MFVFTGTVQSRETESDTERDRATQKERESGSEQAAYAATQSKELGNTANGASGLE